MSADLKKCPASPSRLHDVVRRYGTPTYVYREAVVRERIALLRTQLEPLPSRLFYAMKANAAPALLEIIREEGLGVDVVSPAETELALRLGFEPEVILFSANNMTDEEMIWSHGKGVLPNIGELSRLEKFGSAFPGSKVCVRLNPATGGGHHAHVVTGGARSKFGIPVTELEQVRKILHRYGLRLVGLHQHIGSGIMSTSLIWDAVRVLLEAARSFASLSFLNLGGGLGVPYRPGERPLDLENFQRAIVDPLRRFLSEHPSEGLQIIFEPGRYLVAEAGVLLTRVNTLKIANGRRFAGTDTGMSHLVRPAMYDAYHHVINLSNPGGPPLTYDVVGNICESGDYLARDRAIAEIREGDLLAVLDTGAYGISMASTYNLRPLPAEVLLPAAPEAAPRLLRRRLSPSEFVDTFLEAHQLPTNERS